MKTNTSLMPKGDSLAFDVGGDTTTIQGLLTDRLNVETDTGYLANVRIGSKTYTGSIRTVIEQSQTAAGTRRLLLKAELPVANPSSSTQNPSGCCCDGAKPGDAVPMVTAHVVLALPAEVAQGIGRNDSDSMNRVSAVVRILQSLLSGATIGSQTAMSEQPAVVGSGTLTHDPTDESTLFQPFAAYDPDNSRIDIYKPIGAEAPLWGWIGGLKQL